MQDEKTENRNEQVNAILKGLNWWMEQTYNTETGEIQSTGEAQAAINRYLSQLDELNVKYQLKDGRYHLVEDTAV
jgi:hypothetical protein